VEVEPTNGTKVYGKLVYAGKTTKGIRISLTFFFTLYMAGKVFLESDTDFWGLLVPVLVFYPTTIGYYTYLEVTGRLESFLENRMEKKWGLKDVFALMALVLLFSVIPLVVVYLATRGILLSIPVGLESGLFIFTLPGIDTRAFMQVFNLYTAIIIITVVTLALEGHIGFGG